MSRWTQLAKAHFSEMAQEATAKTDETPITRVLSVPTPSVSKKSAAANDSADQAELEREMVEERAAVMEFDGNLERDLAERMAKAHTTFLLHHWSCRRCIAAGQGRGHRCETGATLWSAYQDAEAEADAAKPQSKWRNK